MNRVNMMNLDFIMLLPSGHFLVRILTKYPVTAMSTERKRTR